MERIKNFPKIEVSPAFILLFAAFYISDMLFVYVLALLSALWHEAGHLLALRLAENRARHIRITPFGIRILKGDKRFFSYQKDIMIYLAGPLFSLAAAVLFYLLFSSVLWTNQTMAYLTGINLVLFFFNLIPVFTLDGGRVLFSLLLLFTSYNRAHSIMKTVSWVCIFLLLFTGAFVLLLTRYNISLLLAGGYLAFTMKNQ